MAEFEIEIGESETGESEIETVEADSGDGGEGGGKGIEKGRAIGAGEEQASEEGYSTGCEPGGLVPVRQTDEDQHESAEAE